MFGPCFVIQFLVSNLVLRSSCSGSEREPHASIVPLPCCRVVVSFLSVSLSREDVGWSEVSNSWSYSFFCHSAGYITRKPV